MIESTPCHHPPVGTQLTGNISVYHFLINLTNLMFTKQFIQNNLSDSIYLIQFI